MADVETPQLEVVEIPDVEEAAGRTEPLPDALPILPLRETVTYPDTLTPLAVGQERSINLVNEVDAGAPRARHARDGRFAGSRERRARPR